LSAPLFSGDPSSDRRSHGAEDEPAALQPAEYAARGPAAQQAFASEHPRVSRDRDAPILSHKAIGKPFNS
jgi:hypothetical protein